MPPGSEKADANATRIRSVGRRRDQEYQLPSGKPSNFRPPGLSQLPLWRTQRSKCMCAKVTLERFCIVQYRKLIVSERFRAESLDSLPDAQRQIMARTAMVTGMPRSAVAQEIGLDLTRNFRSAARSIA